MHIYKYPLTHPVPEGEAHATFHIEMPRFAKILSAGVQGETVMIWALVMPDEEKIKRVIEVYGTGHEMTVADRNFIGTVQIGVQLGSLVWHIFEKRQ